MEHNMMPDLDRQERSSCIRVSSKDIIRIEWTSKGAVQTGELKRILKELQLPSDFTHVDLFTYAMLAGNMPDEYRCKSKEPIWTLKSLDGISLRQSPTNAPRKPLYKFLKEEAEKLRKEIHWDGLPPKGFSLYKYVKDDVANDDCYLPVELEEEEDEDWEEEEEEEEIAATKKKPMKSNGKEKSKKGASDEEEEEERPKKKLKVAPKKAKGKSKKDASDNEEEEKKPKPKKAHPKKASAKAKSKKGDSNDENEETNAPYKVIEVDEDCSITDFQLIKKISATTVFYELTKAEKVSQNKEIIIQDKASKKFYTGLKARAMLNIGSGDAKITLAMCKSFHVWVQSTSHNRKIVAGTRFMYY
eukprot:Phypoly_transcript_10518.p1 GENE.Phypoly_transcript_10518~~Phypoly_transcript_10518.p1  ORF type:complete len:419 (+),score=95.36 Phypoly_transcript_10518:181-1257(+)